MDRKIVVLEYQDNFADDFSTYAYGKILEKKFKSTLFYKNTTLKRKSFEKTMKDFNMECYFISKARADKIYENSNYVGINDIKSGKLRKDKILKLNHFRIDDIKYLTDDIKEGLEFNNTDFIKNYDILENIINSNSIGLYINKNDKIDYKYISDAVKRLNKYIKKPVLYVFSKNNIELETDIKYKNINLNDYREEFYFLRKCRHNIIYCEKNSYSEGLWASILKENNYSYTVYSKKLRVSSKLKNWLAI